MSSTDASPQRALEPSFSEETRLNEKAARVEAQLKPRYSASGVRLSSLNALNAYITQQVTQWQKITG